VKNRVIFPVLFLLLTVVSPMALPAVEPGSTDALAEVETSFEELLCNLNHTTAKELPDTSPVPNPAVEICGTCSQAQCANRNVGASCGPMKWCLDPYGTHTCSDGRQICQCITELP
jgi:hypothetical protein